MMKMAPLVAEMRRFPDLQPILVHTGQHYDYAMSQVFFEQLQMPTPDYNLEVSSGSHHAQTAEVMKRFGELVQEERPDLIVVVGDVNSTMACALVPAKECVPVAHVEAGLRSNDRSMPEEINRVVTDAVSDLLFTTEESGGANLTREGIAATKVFFVGNLMIDSLVAALPLAQRSAIKRTLGLHPGSYAVITLHRPANVDDPERLGRTLGVISDIAQCIPVIFPVHPRTAQKIVAAGFKAAQPVNGAPIGTKGIWTMPPASYLDFIGLVEGAAMVMTDSGGIQEETTYLGVPCLTYRDNTERPVTVQQGTNQLVGTNPENLEAAARKLLADNPKRRVSVTPGFGTMGLNADRHAPPPLWDGKTAPRIVQIMRDFLYRRTGAKRYATTAP